MSDRTIAARLRRIGICLALPFALAAVFAQAAGATTFHPQNATDLFNDVTTANSTPGFNVIVLGDLVYLPSSTQSMTITGNLEITGPPQLQPSQFNGGNPPTINGQNQQASGKPLFTIAAGANVIFKAFDLLQAGGPQWPNTLVNGGTLEVDNMAVAGNPGDGIDVSAASTSNLRFVNSYCEGTLSPGVCILNTGQNGAQVLLVDSTVALNGAAGIAGPMTMHNDVFGGDNPGCDTPAVNTPNTSEDEDGSCGADFIGTPDLGQPLNNGGPTLTSAPGPSSDLSTNPADPAWCEHSDQRFFTATSSSCIIGSYQPNYTLQSDTAGPTCHVDFVHNSPTDSPQSMQVSATDAGVAGQGADTVGNTTIVLKNTTTTNGTVSFPTVPGTLFDETAPGTNILDSPSATAFPVLAQKPASDTTANDTFWSFTATDWVNNQTLCQ